jgi:hypothetical protein
VTWFDNPTRSAGQLAFAAAAVAAALVARRTVAPDLRLWWTVALVFALLWIETAVEWRFVPRSVAQHTLEARGAYGSRTGLQEMLLVALAAGALAAVVAAVGVALGRRRSGALRARFHASTRVAFAATAALVVLFVVEAVSLHAIDAWLYATVGPMLAIGWLWLASSALVVVMAAAHSRGR